MGLALNTSHPCYANLKALVCVDDDNVIKDLVNTSTTFNVDGAVTIGTGTYGRHFRTLNNGFSPSLVTPVSPPSLSNTNVSIVFVVNNISGAGGGNPAVMFGGGIGTPFQRSSGGTTGVSFGRYNSGTGSVQFTAETANTIGNGAHTLCFTRTGTTSYALYKDGASVATGGQIGNDTNPGYFGAFGGESGQSSTGADFVYAIIYDKVLSLSEYQEIHNNLGANNASSLFATSGDTTAPTLTSPTGTQTGSTTASGTVSTNEANGTLYRYASINATETVSTVKAAALTTTVTATGTQSVTFTGLSPSTTYYAHYVHRDAAGNDSTRVSSSSFTTTAGGDTTPPTLTSPTGTGGVLSATGTVSTNEGNGTLYFYCSANSTETASTVVASGSSQAVTGTGTQSVNFGAQTAGTRYAHYVHDDAATNRSARVSSSAFTVTAAGILTSSPLALNNGVLHTNAPFECYVNNATTGALVVKKTGLTSHATTAVVVFNDAAIVSGTQYSIRWRRTDTGAEGLERLTAT